MPNRKISQLERTQALSTKDFLPVLRADGAGGWVNKRINSGDLAFALKKLASSVSSISFLDKPGKHPAFSHSRATVGALCQQFDGSFYQPEIGEIGSHGMRRVENLVPDSEDFSTSAGWEHLSASTGVTPVVTPGGDPPPGTNIGSSSRLQCSRSGAGYSLLQYTISVESSQKNSAGVWARSRTGASQTVYFRCEAASTTKVIGTEWTYISVLSVSTTTARYFSIGTRDKEACDLSIDIDIAGATAYPQRPGQLIPDPEYVSRGVPVGMLDEKVTNGGFGTDSDWTKGANTVISGGVLTISGASASTMQAAGVGKSGDWLVQFDITAETNAGTGVRVRLGGIASGTFQTGVGAKSYILTSNASATGEVVIDVAGTGWQGSIDNVSVREIRYHGWGIDGVQCFATDEYGNDLTVEDALGPDRTGFSLAPSGSNPAAVLAPYGWLAYNSPTTVEVLNGADLHIVSNGSNQGAYWRPTVRAGQVFEMTFEIVGDPGSILITDGSPEPGYSTGAKAPGHHTLRFRALLNGYLNLFLRANTNTAGETTFAGMTIREVYPVRAAGAVRNPAITNSFPVMNKPAANWELAGTTPPVSISDTTLNGLPAVTIRFQSGGDVGYNGCRAANNGGGNHMAIASGKYATMRARIKLSRALTGLESIYFYSTGTGGFEDGFTISAGNSADFTGPNGGYVYTNRRTPFVSAASQYGVFYPSTALTADVDVTINEFQGIALDAQPEVDFVLPSPPVLTVNTSVALAADEDSLDAVAAGWDQSNGGVIALRMRQLYGLSTGKIGRICSVGSDSSNRVFLYLLDGNLILSSNLGGVSQGTFGAATPFTIGEDSTVVMRVEANALRVWVDGVLLISDTSFSVPPASQIVFGSDGAINSGAGELGIAQREAFIFPPGTLTDAECLSLSTGHLPHIPELV